VLVSSTTDNDEEGEEDGRLVTTTTDDRRCGRGRGGDKMRRASCSSRLDDGGRRRRNNTQPQDDRTRSEPQDEHAWPCSPRQRRRTMPRMAPRTQRLVDLLPSRHWTCSQDPRAARKDGRRAESPGTRRDKRSHLVHALTPAGPTHLAGLVGHRGSCGSGEPVPGTGPVSAGPGAVWYHRTHPRPVLFPMVLAFGLGRRSLGKEPMQLAFEFTAVFTTLALLSTERKKLDCL
jgi:hypothetical protein